MNKSTFFSGQPVIAQLINLIPDSLVAELIERHQSDRYYKSFKTRDHLIVMLYGCFHNCASLRELSTGLAASYNKLSHLKVSTIPRRSTVADANSSRCVSFFSDLYHALYKKYYSPLPDSQRSRGREGRLFILDSTTIPLFSDVMRGAGTYRSDGRKKGGVKAHVLLDAKNEVPNFIHLSPAACNDRMVMDKLSIAKNDILVFDKGYSKFNQWQQWTDIGATWVTRIADNQYYEVNHQKVITPYQQKQGVCGDQQILLGRGTTPSTEQITARMVSFYVPSHRKIYTYLTNNFKLSASTIARLYQDRWQVENFFKRFKKDNPIRYFLGQSVNAISIQLWCSFIKDLLVKIVKDQLKRKWSFSNISGMIRHHVMNYLNLFDFLNNPDKIRQPDSWKTSQLVLFPP